MWELLGGGGKDLERVGGQSGMYRNADMNIWGRKLCGSLAHSIFAPILAGGPPPFSLELPGR